MRRARPAELVLGSVQLGLNYGAANRTGKPTRSAACRLVARAADAGVTKFDTARAYGDSEERLGEALRTRKTVRTITKLSPLGDLPPDAPRRAVRAAVDASIAESLYALRRNRRSTASCCIAPITCPASSGAIWERLIERLEDGTVARAGRFGAVAARSVRGARLRRCLSHPVAVQPARLALARGRRHRSHPVARRTSPFMRAASFCKAFWRPTILRSGRVIEGVDPTAMIGAARRARAGFRPRKHRRSLPRLCQRAGLHRRRRGRDGNRGPARHQSAPVRETRRCRRAIAR